MPPRSKPSEPARGRPPLSQKAKGETRAVLLDAAAKIFAQHGYEGASVAQIAAEVGITSGAVYRHFDGKADLLLSLIQERGPTIALMDDAHRTGPLEPAEVARKVSGFIDGDAALIRRLAVEIHTAAYRDAQAGAVLGDFVKASRQSLAARLNAAKQAGAVSPGLDSEMTADIIYVLIMGLCHLDTLDGALIGSPDLKRFLEHSVVRMLTAAGD